MPIKSIKNIVKYIVPNTYYFLMVRRTKTKFLKIKDHKEFIINRYYHKYGVMLDLDNPKTFYEKINYLKLNYYNPISSTLVDKALVKNYLIDLGYEKNIVKMIQFNI